MTMDTLSCNSEWLACRPADDASAVRVFCFPGAGGSAGLFLGWQRQCPSGAQIWPVELPGRGKRMREPLSRDLMATAQAAAEGLLAHLGSSFALFGHSMGALISLEVARILEKEALRAPRCVVLAAAPAPPFAALRRRIHDLPDEELIAELRAINGTPVELLEDEEAMDVLMPIIRADLEMVYNHTSRPSPRLQCPVAVFGGDCDSLVHVDHLRAWQEYTSGPFYLRILHGGHFFITESRDEVLNDIARLVRCDEWRQNAASVA
jgi:medium-chain acyl-[acyl-carrier-protein] hydrolase